MAINTRNLDRLRDFTIDIAVAVIVTSVVTINAMHTFVHVYGGHMDRFLELLRIIVTDDRALGIEQIAMTVALEDGAEVPAMSVIVGELSIVQLGIELADMLEE